jgi:23S rRNA pseudouridine955/2504/2580 synthase
LNISNLNGWRQLKAYRYWVKIRMTQLSGSAGVRHISVTDEHSGRRIDNFLLWLLSGVPKSRVYQMLRKGEVRINGGRVQQDYRLAAGDKLRLPPIRMETSTKKEIVPNPRLTTLLEESVLYEDENLLIINKPSGLAVHGGTGVKAGVIESLRAIRPNAPYLELAHRLDRDTSGCLMIAKDPRVLREFHDLLRNGAVDKRYTALVAGRWEGGRRVVEEGLQKSAPRSGERFMLVHQEGKAAVTEMLPVEIFKLASLMEIILRTGRMHQIRVHAAHVGCPIAGDGKYGDADFNRLMRDEFGLRQLFLHAKSLDFEFPSTRKQIKVAAPLPDTLTDVVKRLRAN